MTFSNLKSEKTRRKSEKGPKRFETLYKRSPAQIILKYLWSFIRIQLHSHQRCSSLFIECTVFSLPKEVRYFVSSHIFVLRLFAFQRLDAS